MYIDSIFIFKNKEGDKIIFICGSLLLKSTV